MEKVVDDYINARQKLVNEFGCNEEYFLKNILDYNWRVKELDGMFFLTYWKENGKLNECVIVKKNNEPYIIKKEKSTLIVAIECVKVALLLSNEMEV